MLIFSSIKCIHNIKYKMYLQNGKMAKLWVFVNFPNKRRFEQIYKSSLQNETMRWITKRRSRREVFCTKGIFKNFTKFKENTSVGVFFLIKLQLLDLKLYLKRGSSTGVFLWMLQNFLATLSVKNTPGGCLCTKDLFLSIFCKEKVLSKAFFNFLV